MIKHVRISNFKSLSNVSVDLDSMTVLIGRSGTGKSNFVEALRFLRTFLTERNPNFVQSAGGWGRILSATASPPMTLSFVLTFDAPGIPDLYEYTLRFQQNAGSPRDSQPEFREEKLTLGNRVLFHQEQGKWRHQPELVSFPSPGNLMLGALAGLPEVSLAHLVLTNGIGCYSFPDLVMASPTARPNDVGLADFGDNYLQAYRAIAINLQTWHYPREIVAALRNLNSSIKSVELQVPAGNQIAVGHQVGGRTLVLDLSQESEGFRRFLAHLIALYQTPPKQTLIFEEPEKGIHPAALEALTEQFKACYEAGRGQVILTTHSPELLDHFEPEQLRVVDIEDYVTKIGPVAQGQIEAMREHLLRPGELLTVDLAEMAAS